MLLLFAIVCQTIDFLFTVLPYNFYSLNFNHLGEVSRECIMTDNGGAQWGKTDFSKCYHTSLLLIRQKVSCRTMIKLYYKQNSGY